MSEEMNANDVARREVVYRIEGMDAVAVRRDLVYESAESESLLMDIYSPPGLSAEDRIPAVVFVLGYSDVGARKILGCPFKEMGSFVSWARLAAASGLAAVTYTTGSDPAADANAAIGHLRRHSRALGIDEERIGLWACSGHAPTALSVLMGENRAALRCATLCYGYTLDLDGSTAVAEAAATFKFANPCAGRSIDEISTDIPLFVARAGRDETPRLNESLDRFVEAALERNLPITLANHPEAPHAFDLFHDSETTRGIIRQILGFLRLHLLAG